MLRTLGAVALTFTLTTAVAQPATSQTLRFMTGPQGGSWVPLAGALKNIWEKDIQGLNVQILPGAGVANVRGVAESRAQIGFGNSISTVDGLQGRAPFPRRAENVCNIGSLYPQWFQLVVLADSGINRVEDLKGRSIALQTRGNTAEVITQHILRAAGLSYETVKPNFQSSYTDAVGLMQDGHAQAFTLGTTIPASAVMDLASSRNIRLLDLAPYLAKMQEINEGYRATPLPANTYPQQQGTPSMITYTTHLIMPCNHDPDQVYRMTKLMWENVETLRNVVGAMRQSTPRDGAQDIGVPLHPGAERYYREVNALPAR